MTIPQFFIRIILFIDTVLVPLVFAIAFLLFIWGVYTYFIAGSGNQEKREEGKKFALYSIGGFVIIVAIWGIVNLLVDSLGFDTRTRPPIPTFDTSMETSAPNLLA